MSRDFDTSRGCLPVAALIMVISSAMMFFELSFVSLKEFNFGQEDQPTDVQIRVGRESGDTYRFAHAR